MAQLDRLLAAMATSHASALRLGADEHVRVLKGGAEHAITRRPLTAAQLLAIVREVAPPNVAPAIDDSDAPACAAFDYAGEGGAFRVAVRRDGGRLTAEVTFAVAAPPIGAGAPPEIVASVPSGIAGDAASSAPSAGASRGSAAADVGADEEPDEPNETSALDGADRAVDIEAQAALDVLLRTQVEQSGSDLHLRSGSSPILRVHGSIVTLDHLPPIEPARVEAMLRAIMPDRNRREFAETADTDFAYELEGAGRFRANVFRDRHGAGAVFRSIPTQLVTAEQLGLSPEVQALCRLTKGLVLVTGPTGSGKSTTLCALIDLVNRTRHDHIITIEDPIEFVHESKGCLITQRQVGVHTSNFKAALRAALREDPDVVLVGELRDLETVSIAIETAETGHLVFGTLHTSTAASTIDRIIDQFPSDRQEQVRVMLSESIKGVISQTLCRKAGGGRVAAMEILLATPALSNLIREAKTFQIPSVMQTSRKVGMVTLNDALLELVESGKVEPKEAYLKAIDKSGIAGALKARGHDVSFLEGDGSVAPAMQGARPDPAKLGVARPIAGVRK